MAGWGPRAVPASSPEATLKTTSFALSTRNGSVVIDLLQYGNRQLRPSLSENFKRLWDAAGVRVVWSQLIESGAKLLCEYYTILLYYDATFLLCYLVQSRAAAG